MDSTRRSKFGSKRKIKNRNLPSTSELLESKLKVDNNNVEKKFKDHVELKKILVSQSSSVNPRDDKFEDSCQLTRLEEELTENPNNSQSHECAAAIQSVTPIESCFHCPKDTPSLVDEAVIGSDHSTKEEENRKEFYYAVKAKVEKAVKEHKIFLIRGDVPMLTKALEARGWLQKYESAKTRMKPYDSAANLDEKSLGDIKLDDCDSNEKTLIFLLLRKVPPDFIWDCRNDFVEWDSSIDSRVFLNRFQRSSVYTSKLGMAQMLEEVQWHYEENISSVLFPRCYNPSRDVKAFLDDFHHTAAVGLLKCFVSKLHENEVELENLSIPIHCLEFAVKRCEEYLDNNCLDKFDETSVNEDEWNIFLEDYSRVVHSDSADIINTGEDLRARFEKCRSAALTILEKMQEIDPQYGINGMRNMWILKPSNLCCGSGIIISHNIHDIFRRVQAKPKNYFAVQKYIEKPLLIQGTKFDIRVWYLVTCTSPLTIWMFEEALLRFSSQTYNISNYHEAIHLCNTAIQQKYDYEKRRRKRRGYTDETTESIRDQGWDCTMLNEYLKKIGYEGEPWFDKIYSKMTESIILTMLASQEHLDRRKCSFELFGADFMVLDDLSIWLIEINSNPRVHPPSSQKTKQIYDNILESLVKVLMDLPDNPDADTGGFRQAYKQHVSNFIPYLGPGLIVMGKRMTLHKQPTANISNTWSRQIRPLTAPPTLARVTTDSMDLSSTVGR